MIAAQLRRVAAREERRADAGVAAKVRELERAILLPIEREMFGYVPVWPPHGRAPDA